MKHMASVACWSLALLTLGSTGRAVNPAAAQDALIVLEERAVKGAVERVAPCVVRIETLGGAEQVEGQLLGAGPTTGLVVSADGYILSSAFAFAGTPTSILVTLPSGQRTAADIVARDHSRMLVLLKVTAPEPLEVPESVPRDELAVGQWTIAVGRAVPGSLPHLSVGILSAINRVWGRAVQTDANISPSNYGGPLLDIRGRVIGLLVPLSPQQEGVLAGAEWYDSGIGFAVPLVDIAPHLERMKQGQDLQPGLLGIALQGSDVYSLPATIAACAPQSPARTAGLQAGDTIVEVDGETIVRQSQLRHALGPRVAGETVRLVVERGADRQRVEVSAELVAAIAPYRRPELGILPARPPWDPGEEGDAASGVRIRHIFPGSPAAAAGWQTGDRLIAIGGQEIADTQALRDLLIRSDPGQTIAVQWSRGPQTATVDVTLGQHTVEVPESVPPAHRPATQAAADRPAVGVVEIQIPEAPNACLALVPDSYDPQGAYGLLVWLPPPGTFVREEWVERWGQLGSDFELIVLAIPSADPQRWQSTEGEFIRKAIDNVMRNYAVDPARVVLHGYQSGATMAYYVALTHRDVARGVVAIGAPLPARLGIPSTDPTQPLAIYSVAFEASEMVDRIEAGVKSLQERAFPVLSKLLPGAERYADAQELADIARWIDVLDRM